MGLRGVTSSAVATADDAIESRAATNGTSGARFSESRQFGAQADIGTTTRHIAAAWSMEKRSKRSAHTCSFMNRSIRGAIASREQKKEGDS
jgi:hypothetical protein